MNATPLLLLIRPERQSERTLAECEAALGAPISAVLSPIMCIQALDLNIDLMSYFGVIVTSVNAVQNAGDLGGISLYCVGNHTMKAAKEAGARVVHTASDAENLFRHLVVNKPDGKVLYLHGEYVATNLQEMLISAGIETDTQILYRQTALPVGAALREAICGDMSAILPLYSPRSARLLGEGVENLGTDLHVITISQNVADVWHKATGGECEVCDTPDGAEMLARIVAGFRRAMG